MLTCGDNRGIHRITETLNLMEIALSIEQALKDLTEAVVLNTTALNKLLSGTATVAGSPSTTTASTDADDTADTTDEAPKRERGKPSPGKSKRTAAEVAEDKAADEADAAAAAGDDAGETAAAGAVTFDSLKKELSVWLGEWAKAEDRDNPEGTHPEVGARKDAIKTLLGKLGAEKLPDIAGDAAKIGKLHTWLNGSGKEGKKDKATGELVFGPGRWAADPEPAGDDGGDEDLDI